MKTINRAQLLRVSKQAFEKFGKENQMRQLQEECAELIAAVNHHMRGRDPKYEELSEEIADVMIVLIQIQSGLDLSEKITHFTNIKLQRLETKLK